MAEGDESMITTKDKLAFALAMGRHTRADVRQVQRLLRYAGTLRTIAETRHDSIEQQHGDYDRRERLRLKVKELCFELSAEHADGNVTPLFDGPRLKIRVPSGEEIEVPA